MKQELLEKGWPGSSELLKRERDLDVSEIHILQNLFWEFNFLRKPSQTIEPFDPLKMEAHIRLSGLELSKWEYNTLMEMDLAFRVTSMRRD